MDTSDPGTSKEHRRRKRKDYFNIYKYDAALATAFQTDCERLLTTFKNRQTFSFEAFSQDWRQACFTGVFADQEFIIMLEAFTNNCFFVAKKFLFSDEMHIQVGGLYLLYSLYSKQPVRGLSKIRLTQMEATKIIEIVESLKAHQAYEPWFIFCKMRLNGAFNYVATVQPLGPQDSFVRRYDLSADEIFGKAKVERCLNKFKTCVEQDPDIRALRNTDKEYQELMKKYSEKCRDLAPPFSSMTPWNKMKRSYNRLFGVELSDSDDEIKKEAYQKEELKRKAMSNVNAMYRGDKKVTTGVEYGAVEKKILNKSSNK